MNNNTKIKENTMAFMIVLLAFLGWFFMVLNPSETATEAQFVLVMLLTKAAMLVCWIIGVRIYRRLYNLDGKGDAK